MEIRPGLKSCLLIYSGVHITHVQGVYLCIRPMCLEIGIFFFIIENSEFRNLDGGGFHF